MARKKAGDYDQSLLDLYDRYAHDLISRREFLDTARKFAMAGFTATAILESLSPKYAEAKQLATDDKRLSNQYIEYLSANGSGIMRHISADQPVPGISCPASLSYTRTGG